MDIKKNSIYFLVATLLATSSLLAQQKEYWFYLRANDSLFEPTFIKNEKELLTYTGEDKKLAQLIEPYRISTFKKTRKKAKKKYFNSTFFVVANSASFLDDILKYSSLFDSGEIIQEEDMKIFEPNDYGITATIGDNLGANFNFDYLDAMEVPKAWYYTTGDRNTPIGISDGAVDTTNLDFKGKTTVFRQSGVARGHGYSIGANAAAQGNNGYGIPGVCYDCSIYATKYGDFKKFSNIHEVAKAGARVINCSWIGPERETGQAIIDSIFDMGTIVVAGGGNYGWDRFQGDKKYYPASYDKVIAVSSVQYRYADYTENIGYQKKNGKPYVAEIWGFIGRTGGFKDDDINKPIRIYNVSTATLNDEIDILAPTVGLFRFSQFILKGTEEASGFSTTSGATALVSGTVGLMFSLNPCLPHDEVESILKITSMNVDHIEANKRFAGLYGAGMLNTGRAVEMVHQLYNPFETAYIENQNFSRWDFKITSLSKNVVIQNQKFTDKATLQVEAKNQIIIGTNTHLKPNKEGSIALKINPTLEKQCELQYRDPSVIRQ